MADTRPLYSAPEVIAIAAPITDALKLQLDAAFASILALPGNPEERENDALSFLAHVGSLVALYGTVKLIHRKSVPAGVALRSTLEDYDFRIRRTLQRMYEIEGNA